MNPFIYKEFQKDMIEATKDFVLNTDYEIEDVSDYAIRLCNGKKRIIFTLEAFDLLHQIENVDGSSNMSIYELFEKEGIMNEYPKISIPKFSSIEESLSFGKEVKKYRVKRILEILSSKLIKHI